MASNLRHRTEIVSLLMRKYINSTVGTKKVDIFTRLADVRFVTLSLNWRKVAHPERCVPVTSKPEIEVQPSPTVPLRPHNSASNVKSPAITHNHGAPKEGEHHAGSLFQTPITYQGIAQ